MNAQDLKTLTTDALDRLATLLDQGHSDQLACFLKAMARFHRYSFHNVCLIASQRPSATRVAGFHAWRALNRFVRKGEKGIVILAPIVTRRRTAAVDDDSKSVAGFRSAYVFDVEQTDGEPLPTASRASGDPGRLTLNLRAAIAAHGIALDDVDDLEGALGTSAGGRIHILKCLPAAEEFSVLVHEFAHELLHHNADRPTSRDIRELEAEAVAFVVGEAIGLQIGDAARDYIQLYRGDRDRLLASLDRVRGAATTILSAIDVTRPAGDSGA
ncbi:MAG TPA: ArdC-like ssDNA-binding domain-containing protein [Vicinamibacterales bacterium]|nr:ArdC-like ssDNA-binding domain-containing protein [Vicinamibacterales bacterium]